MMDGWVGTKGFDEYIDDLYTCCASIAHLDDIEEMIELEREHRPAGLDPRLTGYCYALVNESMPGLVKIGMTTKDPRIRTKQLSQQTASPTPFILVYFQRYFDCRDAEQFIHGKLDEYRVGTKEFFRVDIGKLPKLFHWVNCRGEE